MCLRLVVGHRESGEIFKKCAERVESTDSGGWEKEPSNPTVEGPWKFG